MLTDILLPYFIMETIWSLVQFLVEGKSDFNPSTPSWTLWFLLALGIFRLILPYPVLFRWPLLLSIVFSVGVGYLKQRRQHVLPGACDRDPAVFRAWLESEAVGHHRKMAKRGKPDLVARRQTWFTGFAPGNHVHLSAP